MQTVLVTGGAGFIGSHTCKALAAAGLKPVAFDNLSTGHADLARFGPLVEGDILDGPAVDAAFAQHRPDAVIHFAALAYVGASMREPLAYYRVNVAGLVNVVEAMLRHGVPSIVFSSSCATYGIPERIPINRERTTATDQPVWTLEARRRADPGRRGCRRRLQGRHAALFQRRRRGSGRRA